MLERSDYNSLLGRNILRAKAAKRMPGTQLEVKSGISRETIRYVEKGERGCTVHTLYMIAEGLGVSPAELLPDPLQITRTEQIKRNK